MVQWLALMPVTLEFTPARLHHHLGGAHGAVVSANTCHARVYTG